MACKHIRDYPNARGYKLLSRRVKVSHSLALRKVKQALYYLRQARALYREAGCPKVLQRVELAINSGKGAVRAVGYRPYQ